MKKISDITRRDIVDAITNGFLYKVEDSWIDEEEKVFMPYFGRMNEFDFLNRIYPLTELPSYDGRFSNAFDDISCHSRFDDYEPGWIFSDDRFRLMDSDDEPILILMCEMLHPAVRDEKGPWKKYLDKFNELLEYDGYELYAKSCISGRNIYSYREKGTSEDSFTTSDMFSERYKEFINTDGCWEDNISSEVDFTKRKRICKVLFEFAEPQSIRISRYDNYTENSNAFCEALKRINDYLGYPLLDLDLFDFGYGNLEDRLASYFTPYLFDIIELQYDELSMGEKTNFQQSINRLFKTQKIAFRLSDRGLIEQVIDYEVLSPELIDKIEKISEPGVAELTEEAIKRHMQPTASSQKDAVEKIWDAFERVKTIYTGLNKKASAEKLIDEISGDTDGFADILNREFAELTKIGNEYRIRHHETDKKEIRDIRHYNYLFNRCLSVIILAAEYIK